MRDLECVVVSFDKYAALWPECIQRIKRHFPQLEVGLVSNQLDSSSLGVKSLKVGKDKSWSENLRSALKMVESKYVFLTLDDVFFTSGFYKADLIEQMLKKDVDYINLKGTPLTFLERFSSIVRVPENRLYRAALVPCIWKKSTLEQLLVDGESAWDFEINGSERSNVFPEFYSIPGGAVNWLHVLIQGKLTWHAVRRVQDQKIQNSFAKISPSKNALLLCRVIASRSASLLPFNIRKKLRAAILDS